MRSIVTYETQHGSAKKLAMTIAEKLGCLCINVDTPFQAENEADYDNLIVVFNFRGPYTAQLTKLFISKMKGKLNYKRLMVVGEGLFSQKEFPSVAQGLKDLANPYSFHSFFMAGQLREATLTPEERAILAQFSKLTGMVIQDMGQFEQSSADDIANQIKQLTESLEVPVDPNAGKNKWICTICGYVHTGDNPPEKCPTCGQPADKFKLMSVGKKKYKCNICGKEFEVENGQEAVCPLCGAKGENLVEIK